MTHQEYLTDFIKTIKEKRISVAERFREQNLHRESVDLLTGDKQSVPKLPHPPLVPLPFEPLTKIQILSLYDIPFTFLLN